MPHVLVVDDDPTVAQIVVDYLLRDGYTATSAGDGPSALEAAAHEVPDLVVLDLMLPGMDGFEVCRALRVLVPDLPVVMLTARGESEDRIAGLEVGADDYVTKPFSARELVLRVQSVLRRSAATAVAPTALVDGDLVIEPVARRVTRGGQPLALTGREFDLLVHLVTHPGEAFTREQLLRDVWGWEFGDLSTVTVHVRRLREKVEPQASSPVRLATVWGTGYRWDPM